MTDYHKPVLLVESIDELVKNVDGIYVDVTFGGGGHSKEILKRLSAKGRLIVFDQDSEAEENALNDPRITFVKSNFRFLHRFWKWMDIQKVDGILADLGVSSHQFDADYRGFSYRYHADLDMRMNEKSDLTAKQILADYHFKDLQDMFSEYGEVRNAKKLASAIIDFRSSGRAILTTTDLNTVLEKVVFGDKMKYFSQVYQALRIQVNDEMKALKDLLTDTVRIMAQDGKLVVISYHSLEDRLVKRFMKSGNTDGKIEKDEYGKSLSKIKMDKKLILPNEEEQNINVRSRSAKMRIATRL